MLISKWTILMISILGEIKCILSMLIIVSLVMFPLLLAVYLSNEKKFTEIESKIMKYSIVFIVASILLSIIIPSEKTMYLMFISDYVTADNRVIAKETIITTMQEISKVLK